MKLTDSATHRWKKTVAFLIFLKVLCFTSLVLLGVWVGLRYCWSVFVPSSCCDEILELVDHVSYHPVCNIPVLATGTAPTHLVLKRVM